MQDEYVTGLPIYGATRDGLVLDNYYWPLAHIMTFTAVPNFVFDDCLSMLSGAELKVFLYIVRRTIGFRKVADAISYSQFLNGIVKRDGERLDYGCGVKSRSTLSRALKRLEERGLIEIFRRDSEQGDSDTTVYWILPAEFNSNSECLICLDEEDGYVE